MRLLSVFLQNLNIGSGAVEEVVASAGPSGYREQGIVDVLIDSWYINGPLLVLSVIAVYIFLERSMAVNKALQEEKDFMNKIKDYITNGKLDSAMNLCATTNNPVARMLGKGISRIGKSLKEISVSIENVGKLELYQLEKNISTLATIAGAAPMIGFLGTVIGMVQVFYDIQVYGTDIEVLGGGMQFAMVTTIFGLIVGIIAYMAYNYLVARVSKVIHKMEAGTIEFIDILEEPGK